MNVSQVMLQQPVINSGHPEEDEHLMTAKQSDLKKAFLQRRYRPIDHGDNETIENIDQVFDQRQLMIINDHANGNVCQESNFKDDLRAGLGQKIVSLTTKQLPKPKRQSVVYSRSNIEKKEVKCIGVLTSEHKFRIAWDLFTMVVIFIAILILPLDISFTIDSDFFVNINYATIVIFSIDILINFNTAFQLKGQYVEDRRLIALEYIKLWFWIDLVSTFPFDIIIDVALQSAADDEQADELAAAQATAKKDQLVQSVRLLRILKFFRFIKVVRLLRVLKLKKIFAKFEDYIDLSATMVSLYQVLKLTFIMLFVAHWLACIWHFIADQELQSGEDSWLNHQELQASDWYIKYIASVYWATATMTTVGYGDIVPVTSVEKIFGIIVMLLACCIFAYIMNSIGGIFVTMDQNEKVIRQKMGQANQFLKSNEIPKDLQARVRKYLEYKYEKESNQVDEKQALLVLSSSLRDEVLAEVNIKLISESKIFQSKFDKEILVQLPFILEEQIFGPEECIFLEGYDNIEKENGDNLDERCLYFLNQGQIMLCIQRTFTWLKTLEKGETFGELGFFSNRPRCASAYTLDFVYVQKLKKKDFLLLLKTHNSQNQHYQMDKYLIEIQDDYSPLGLHCYGCKDTRHFSWNCPKLHHCVDLQRKLELIDQVHVKSKAYMREFKRFEKVRYNARGCLELTNEVANEINYVYHGQEEVEVDKLQRLQIRFEDEPTDEIVHHIEKEIQKSQQIDTEQHPLDRLCIFQYFFPEYNAELIFDKYNKIIDENINRMKQEPQVARVKLFQNWSNQRRKERSSSAERAVYFEQLIEKHGGPASFLEKLNNEQ